jgi:CDP-ribitol ribitolphosphotransferase
MDELMAHVREKLANAAKHFYYFGIVANAYRLRSVVPPKKKSALFVEVRNEKPSDSFLVMIDELERRGYHCEVYSWGKNRVSGAKLAARSVVLAWKAASVRVLFLCEACMAVGCLPVRRDAKVVQLWHGCGAFKRFGMSTAEKIFGETREVKKYFPEHRSTSLVTVSSPEVRWAYIEALDMGDRPECVQATGVSRTDVFFRDDFLKRARDEAVRVVPSIADKNVLLYAPTFRGHVKDATAPEFLDIEELHERLGDDWILLVKQHPHVKNRPPIPASCADFAFDVSESLSIESAMIAADVCVTDYSSLVFEWSLLARPIAFLAPDRNEYDDWRGFYYDYDDMTPGPVFNTTAEVAEWTLSAKEGYDYQELEDFRNKFMSSCDGSATERILNDVLGDVR